MEREREKVFLNVLCCFSLIFFLSFEEPTIFSCQGDFNLWIHICNCPLQFILNWLCSNYPKKKKKKKTEYSQMAIKNVSIILIKLICKHNL